MDKLIFLGRTQSISNFTFDTDGNPNALQKHKFVYDSDNNSEVIFVTSTGHTYSVKVSDLGECEDRTYVKDRVKEIAEKLVSKPTLDLTSFMNSAKNVKAHTVKDVFFHLAEEVGEVATCIQRPHKAVEPLAGELADVLNCTLDIFYQEYGDNLPLLQRYMDEKCAKWLRVQGK